ncbi:TIGR04104 family putative zinc finger protein [Alkalicoccus halolimnae]|uniref:TIGR04104 family putative zinc finger protein n=1 Tax=Alkalicoccus halolimnae TaxID=1667239 RepID=A0A5C7F6H3_9BACI|nr:TIGR04104 family putative zinc finger protein [Alkalicoccus halolimnae]TXF85170.1 hypothetical protein FTX54_10150 [Alkalicoccus halolimnae]
MKQPICPNCKREFKYREVLFVNRSKICPSCKMELFPTPASRKKQGFLLFVILTFVLSVRLLLDLNPGLYLLISTGALIIILLGVPFITAFTREEKPMFRR